MPPRSQAAAPARFRERSDLLDFLLEVSAVTSETLDLDQLLASVSGIVKKVIDCEIFAILLYSEKRQELRIRHALGHRQEVVRNLVVKLGEGITGVAAQLREPVLVGDVREDPRYLNAVDAVRTELAVPMIARGRLVGVIDAQSAQLNGYTEYDRDLLLLIASRVATAIDNARLYWRVERQNRTLRTLANISQEFSSLLNLDELLKKISTTVRNLINYDAFSILLVDEERQTLRHRFSSRYDQRIEMDNLPLGKGITGAAVVSREPVRVHDTLADPRYIASHAGVRSEVAVPLVSKDRVIGVMDLESDRVGFFTDDHVRLLSLLAPQIATSLENARLYKEVADREHRMERDLAAASELQRLILPAQAPPILGLEVAAGLRPAREISGDIYDFFEHSDDRAVLAFGDVSGKGVAAALFGALVSGLLRTLAPRRPQPGVLMKALNEALIGRKVESRYVTLLLMLWDPQTRTFTVANAGAFTPMVFREGQNVRVRAEGVPLGLLANCDYEETVLQAEPGDTLVLYSDGITDHTDGFGEEYGRGRLARLVPPLTGQSSAEIRDAIFADVDRFGSVAFDDQTVVVIKVS
ncbi:MAG: SpoIIE family protein phosphatase [Bryobacteraceae bacterium]